MGINVDSTRENQTDTHLYVCSECGCPEVEESVWVDINTGKETEEDSPLGYYWCPNCEANVKRVCLVNTKTGECLDHEGHNVKPNFNWKQSNEKESRPEEGEAACEKHRSVLG